MGLHYLVVREKSGGSEMQGYYPYPGQTIEDAAQAAVAQVNDTQEDLVMSFSSINIAIKPGDNPEIVVANYRKRVRPRVFANLIASSGKKISLKSYFTDVFNAALIECNNPDYQTEVGLAGNMIYFQPIKGLPSAQNLVFRFNTRLNQPAAWRAIQLLKAPSKVSIVSTYMVNMTYQTGIRFPILTEPIDAHIPEFIKGVIGKDRYNQVMSAAIPGAVVEEMIRDYWDLKSISVNLREKGRSPLHAAQLIKEELASGTIKFGSWKDQFEQMELIDTATEMDNTHSTEKK